jgi:uncharacterized protein (TIGR02231 family)
MIPLIAAAYAETIAVTGKPVEVTVYRSQARVTRHVDVPVGSGRQEVVFDGLPASLRPQTVSAALTGAGTLRGIDVRRVPAAQIADERSRDVKTRLDGLTAQRQAADDRATAARRRLDALTQARTAGADALSRQLLVGKSAPNQLTQLRTLLSADDTQARDALRDAELQRAAIDREIAAVKRELQALGAAGTDTWRAVVQIDARPGTLSLDLTYLVDGASWTPRYDVRGDAEAARVEIALSARIAQTTGEDWSGVRLIVSSATPGLGTTVPELSPFSLERPYRAPPAPRPSRAAAPAAAKAELVMEEADDAAPAPPPPMEVATAAVDVQLSATAFTVARPADLPSDGSERSVLLTTEKMAAELRWVVVPRLDERVYLVGKVENTASFPLLPGTAGTFLGSAYLGDFSLPAAAPGEKFDVAFGIDEHVTVHRTPRTVETTNPTVTKRRASTWAWQLDAKNAYKRTIMLTVAEQVPITSRTDTTVALLPGKLAPTADEQGRLSFALPVPAGQSATLQWGYRVEYPSDLNFGWLE